MRCIFIFFLLLYATNLLAQNRLVDEKVGCKDFLPGDTIARFDHFLVAQNNTDNGQLHYLYTPGNPNDYVSFGKKFSRIHLYFDSTLHLITIELVKSYSRFSRKKSLRDFKTLLAELYSVFGSPSINMSEEKDPDHWYLWHGIKVYMMVRNMATKNNTSANIITIAKYTVSKPHTEY
jgi:hypothetical protein